MTVEAALDAYGSTLMRALGVAVKEVRVGPHTFSCVHSGIDDALANGVLQIESSSTPYVLSRDDINQVESELGNCPFGRIWLARSDCINDAFIETMKGCTLFCAGMYSGMVLDAESMDRNTNFQVSVVDAASFKMWKDLLQKNARCNELFGRTLSEQKFIHVLVKDGSQAVGVATLYINETIAHLYNLKVRPGAERQNIGRSIVQYLKGCARERGCRHIIVVAPSTQLGFYEKVGFIAQRQFQVFV